MAFPTNANQVLAFAGAMYGVQVGSVTMAQVNSDIISSGGLNKALNSYYAASFGSVSTTTVGTSVATNLGLTGAALTAGASYITAQLNAATAGTRGEVINNILNVFSGLSSDATYGAAATAWNAKVNAAAAYKGEDNLVMGTGATFQMSVNLDDVVGSAGADTFNARVVQNMNGEQTNQLATGDFINGGAGTDTLTAKVIAASPLNAGPMMSITPETVDVENVAFTALRSIATSALAETVEINAKFMNGLDKISSVQSDASFLVTNVNTLTDNGVYAEKRLTESLTVRMDHSGNDLTVPQSNMTVKIDNDYLLRADPTKSATLFVSLTPQIEAVKYDATVPLKNNPYDTLIIKVNGVPTIIKISAGTPATPVQTTYADLEVAIKAGLVAAGLSDVVVTRTVGAFVYSARDGTARTSDTFTFSKAGSVLESQGAGSWAASAGLPDDNSFGAIVRPGDASSTAPLITVQVELEKVGRGSDGGGLIIGAMATDNLNEWDHSSTPNLAEGVEKFNVKVSGDASQFSSLAYLHSTNNTLQNVVVTSATGSKASLIIGNHNTTTAITDAMKDVRDFDSTAFANNVTLNASLTTEVVAKYLDLKDTAAPAADNVTFKYNFGAGNDKLNLVVDKSNLDNVGTTTREDFVLSIDGGAGNDSITVDLVGSFGAADIGETGAEAWYNNSKINANMSIAGGAGNDTISTKGGGDYKINAGSGDDTVYSDNSGRQTITLDSAGSTTSKSNAVWVFNTTDQTSGGTPTARELDDLISSSNSSYNLYKGTATVTFRSLTASVVIESSTSTYKSTDLQINQAIKKAINSDAVLSKLIVATDGPANTLVVKSLIDGTRVDADLAVAIAKPAAGVLTPAEIGAIAAVYTGTADETTVLSGMATPTNGDYDARLANDGPTSPAAIAGSESDSATDSTHTLDTGNDVLVLSTNVGGAVSDLATAAAVALAKATASNETVVYAAAFGNDTIVNFGISTVTDTGVKSAFTFTVLTAASGNTFAFNGATVTLDGADTTTAATAIAAGINAVSAASWSATSSGAVVTLTAKNAGVLPTGTVASSSIVLGSMTGTVALSATGIGTVTDADLLNFRAFLGTTSTTLAKETSAVAAADTNSLVIIANADSTGTALTGVRNDSAAEIALLYADNLVANKSVYIAVSTGNVGSVYSVVDGTAAGDLTVTLMGTIDLADTDWTTLTAANFS
jgi:hypothetical protein